MKLLQLVLNVIWFVTAGLWLSLAYLIFGLIACLPIITIPFGLASIRIANYVLWPFGRTVVDRRSGAASGIGNLIWFLVAGVWLAIGHLVTAAAQAATIIGLPMAWANLKLIPVTCFPFGKEIVTTGDSRAVIFPTTAR